MHIPFTCPKFSLPIALSVGAFCLILVAQPQLPQQTMGLLQGFDQAQWDRERPEKFVPFIRSKLQTHSRTEVTALLGAPDQSGDAGEGMFGPYQAYYSYILDCEKDQKGVRQNSYTWNDLEISFSPDDKVSKIEVRGHAY